MRQFNPTEHPRESDGTFALKGYADPGQLDLESAQERWARSELDRVAGAYESVDLYDDWHLADDDLVPADALEASFAGNDELARARCADAYEHVRAATTSDLAHEWAERAGLNYDELSPQIHEDLARRLEAASSIDIFDKLRARAASRLESSAQAFEAVYTDAEALAESDASWARAGRVNTRPQP